MTDNNDFSSINDEELQYTESRNVRWIKVFIFLFILFAIILLATWLYKSGSKKPEHVEATSTETIEIPSNASHEEREYMSRDPYYGGDQQPAYPYNNSQAGAQQGTMQGQQGGDPIQNAINSQQQGADEFATQPSYGAPGVTHETIGPDGRPVSALDGTQGQQAQGTETQTQTQPQQDATAGEDASLAPLAGGAAAAGAAAAGTKSENKAVESKPKKRAEKKARKSGQLTPQEILRGKAGAKYKKHSKASSSKGGKGRALTPQEILRGKAGRKYR